MNLLAQLENYADLRQLRDLLIYGSLGALCFLPAGFFAGSKAGSALVTGKSTPVAEMSAGGEQEKSLSLEEYQSHFLNNSFFGFQSEITVSTPEQSNMNELIASYHLKGVILLGAPEAIVESSQTRKTQFVRVGDFLGLMTVKDISDGKIILEYQGEQAVLQIDS